MAALGEAFLLPNRAFELFPGDPLYAYWKESDKTPFHSWVDGEEAEESIEALIPEGQPLAAGRIQASRFTWQAKKTIQQMLGPAAGTLFALGRCLEWDTPHYVIKAFKNLCARYDVLQYADGVAVQEEMRVHLRGTRLVLELSCTKSFNDV